MPKRFDGGALFPREQPRAVQLSWEGRDNRNHNELDTKGEMFCWCSWARDRHWPSEERGEFRPPMNRLIPRTFSGSTPHSPPKFVIFLSDLKNNFSNENASSIVTKWQVELQSNHGKNLCQRKRPSMAHHLLGSSAHFHPPLAFPSITEFTEWLGWKRPTFPFILFPMRQGNCNTTKGTFTNSAKLLST